MSSIHKKRVDKLTTTTQHLLIEEINGSFNVFGMRLRSFLTDAQLSYFGHYITAKIKAKLLIDLAKWMVEKSDDPDFEAILGKIRSDPQSVELVLKVGKDFTLLGTLKESENLG